MYPIEETVYRYCFSSCTIRLLAKEKNVRRRGGNYFSISSLLVSYMRVLILYSTTCLSDTQLTNIRRFVVAGGGLVIITKVRFVMNLVSRAVISVWLNYFKPVT